jgi:peroxiredoxin
LLLGGIGCGAGSGEEQRAVLFAPAPDVTLQTLAGKPFRLQDYKDKVILLDFWATYCQPCHDSIPVFQKLHEEFNPKGLAVIGISIDVYSGHVGDFAKEIGMTYPVALDTQHDSAAAYGVTKLPVTWLVGRDGRLLRRWDGFNPVIGEEIREEVVSALATSPRG